MAGRYDYDIIIRAQIEIGGKYSADNGTEAVEAAKRELRASGEISDVTVERCVFLDDETAGAAEEMGEPLPDLSDGDA